MWKSLKLCLAIIVLVPQMVLAQYNMLFTSDYEVANSLVNKIAEDSNGMVWIASENGLGMYNGSRFITFENIPGNPNSLASNFVRTVCTNDKGHVIVGSCGGVQVFQPVTGLFTPVLTDNAAGIAAGNVNDVTPLHDGSFLVLGSECFTLVEENGKWYVRKNLLTNKVGAVLCGIEAPDGSIFVSEVIKGTQRIDKKGRRYSVRDVHGRDCDINAFCIGSDGRLYAGSNEAGVFVYSSKSKCFLLLPGTENMQQIRDIKRVSGKNQICIATDGNGVYLYDTKLLRRISTQQFASPLVDISTQKVHSVFINKTGDVWMALYQKGIFIAPAKQTAFTYIGNRSRQYDLIGNKCVTSLLQTHDGNIWVTTDNGGLYGFSPSLQSLRKYPADVRPNGVPSTILGLFEDTRHRVWYGSYGRGGGMVDVSTGFCTPVQIAGVATKDFNIYGYVEDKRGQVWVASMGNGILRYDENRYLFVPYISSNAPLWSDAIFYDRQHDRIYCATYSGVASFSPTDGKKNVKTLITDHIVYSISKVSSDMLAFSTNNGLVLYTVSTDKCQSVTTKQGLPDNNVCGVQTAKDGSLWISTMKGLTHFNLKDYLKMTFADGQNANLTITYTIRDGLQGNEFYKNASIVSRDGRMWFGGINGITTFLSQDVNRNHTDCKVLVVDLRAGEVYLRPNEDGEYVIDAGINSFTVSFATLPLYMTHRVTYSYRVDDEEWEILTAPQNRISINNLSYGSHLLEVKTTIDGKDTEVSSTNIYIRYPWYLKWWMVCLWIVLAVALGWYLYVSMQRRRRFVQRLRQQQQEQELKESKLQFFMNIVHDLRTPLTLIFTPLQKLKKSDADTSRQHLYDIMERNTDRLLRLTNEIMDLRKLDRGMMELHPHLGLISKFIRETAESMNDIAETRHQQLTLTDHTDGTQMLMFDAENLEKILINLISNALKYTPEGGHVSVAWDIDIPHPSSSFSTSAKATVTVTDNGIGIPDSEKEHIFERFYQVRTSDKHIKGTGIGLNLVKALVDLHKGTIFVCDNPEGHGTCFTVTLPMEQADNNAPLPDSETLAIEKVEPSSFTISCDESQDSNLKAATKRTILIVDDDDDIRGFLMEELSATYNVMEAADGKTAFAILTKTDIDLVVSDIMMPYVDGIELIQLIRGNVRLAHLPVILLTAKVSDQDRIEGLQASADAYVTKPFNFELLETLISNQLIRHGKLRNTFSGKELPVDRIDTPEVESADEKLMERILKVINDNLDNPDLTSDMLAREAGISRVHMYRKLKELTNQPATKFVRNIRLTKAAELLRQGKVTVSEVAYLVGFRAPAHFSTAFKELYGMSPKEYISTNA